jgi:uncharacterized DUF497 family protein
MTFEWDSAKSDACFDERGFDFAFASYVFRDPRRLERRDTRRKYREVRLQTIGEINEATYFVVYTRRRGAIRIISARRASDEEDKAYREGGIWQ